MLSWATFAGVWLFSFFASAFFHFAFSFFVPLDRNHLNSDRQAIFEPRLDTKTVAIRIVDQKELPLPAEKDQSVTPRQSSKGLGSQATSSKALAPASSFHLTEPRSKPLALHEPKLSSESSENPPSEPEPKTDGVPLDSSMNASFSQPALLVEHVRKVVVAFEACPEFEDLSWLDDFRDFEFFPRSYHAVIQFSRASASDAGASNGEDLKVELLEFDPQEAKPSRFIDERLAKFFLSCLNAGYFLSEYRNIAALGEKVPSLFAEGGYLHEMKVIYTRRGVEVP